MKRKEDQHFYNSRLSENPFDPRFPNTSSLSRDTPPAALFRNGPPPGGGSQFRPPLSSSPGFLPPNRFPQPTPPNFQPPRAPGGEGDEIIESEFVEIEDAFIERPRRTKPPPPDISKPPPGYHHQQRHHPPPHPYPPRHKEEEEQEEDWPNVSPQENTALLRRHNEDERRHYRFAKVIYLFLFGVAVLEVVLITAFSGWFIHMVSCISYGSCSPTQERLQSFGIYFAVLFAVFIVPYMIGGLGVALSSARILWFFSFVSVLIDVVIIVLLCVYYTWEIALGMIPLILASLFGFAMSSILRSEEALRGPHAKRNRCCLYLCG